MDKKIRSLRPEEIEIRVSQVLEKGVQLLLYKDSRCDKRILDETFGINGWKNKYEEIKGNLFCTISIWDDNKKQWIDKCDCGIESRSDETGNEKKGEASDSFKRAGFNVGIGRELYTRIFYFAKVPTKNISDNSKKPKYEMVNKYEKFTVKEIHTNEETEKIEKIKIVDSKGNVVFNHGYTNSKVEQSKTEIKQSTTQIKETIEMIEDGQVAAIQMLFKEINNNELKKKMYAQVGIKSSKELTKKQATSMIKALKKIKGE